MTATLPLAERLARALTRLAQVKHTLAAFDIEVADEDYAQALLDLRAQGAAPNPDAAFQCRVIVALVHQLIAGEDEVNANKDLLHAAIKGQQDLLARVKQLEGWLREEKTARVAAETRLRELEDSSRANRSALAP